MTNTEIRNGFIKHFNIHNWFCDPWISAMTQHYELDIIAFDNWCITEHNYNIHKHGSLEDFILLKWGTEANDFIDTLLNL
jgi:hypothetical protein